MTVIMAGHDAGLDAQVTPLYGAIGAGCVMCAYVCAIKISGHPDVVYALLPMIGS